MNGFGTVHTDTLSQQVTIPANATKATLSFWLYVYTAETTTTVAYDNLSVQIRNSSGAVLTTLATYSNLSPKSPYAQVTFDITSFKGQTIQVYLVGTEDQGLQTSFIIDDFTLDVIQ
jgi:kumamolisin